jgi:prepilin-type processing-associated H-X9-DG protein
MLHGRASNFLFKDGHVKAYNVAEASFNSEFIPAK